MWTTRSKEHEGRLVERKGSFSIIECSICGFKHIIPIPDLNSLKEEYQESFYEKIKPNFIRLKNEDAEWWDIVYNDLLNQIEDLLRKDAENNLNSKNLLDIGCGPGFFLKRAKAQGWNVTGIEPSMYACRYARDQLKIDVICGSIDEVTLSNCFDAVVMYHVLEHLPYPHKTMDKVHAILKPKGVLCVVVPNDYNKFQMIVREAYNIEPWWVSPPHHINYFNKESLEKLVRAHGFDVAITTASFPIDIFLLFGDNYIGNDELGRKCHAKRKHFELLLEKAGERDWRREFYKALASLGVGRDVIIYAIKR